ncbi:polysaccharide deacetylase family protein [Cytobacillus gottheilii]|uniref:polysaccharide deacetylase family protein n=1 Tax=Cytobacillus gottheilii TaxID=859144 RepID=UPI0009BAB6B0|nr:polysaccharide deacetylase family protein [Cytobacillus gottheilii]
MAFYFPNVDPAYIYKRKGTEDDPFLLRKESFKVRNNKITLREIPSFKDALKVFYEGNPLEETELTTIEENQFRVDYSTGIVYFHSSREGQLIDNEYYGTGYVSFPSERVWLEGGQDVETSLQDLVDNVSSETERLSQVDAVQFDSRLTEVSHEVSRLPEIQNEIGILNEKNTEFTTQLTQTSQKVIKSDSYSNKGLPNVDSINFYSGNAEEPIVTFIDDDGRSEVYSRLFPIFQEKGAPLVAAICSDYVGMNNYMTATQIKEMHDNGHEIINHNSGHAAYLEVGAEEWERQIKKGREDLYNNGYTHDIFVYPKGQSDPGFAITKKYAKCAFDNVGQNLPGELTTYGIKRIPFGSNFEDAEVHDFDYYKAIVDTCVSKKTWLVFMLHVYAQDAQQDTLLSQIIDYIKGLGVKILSASDAYALRANKLEINGKALITPNGEFNVAGTQLGTYIDTNTPTFTNSKISNLLRTAKDRLSDVNYIMVGDSTRASNGSYIYEMVSPVLQALNATTYLSARSGLRAKHWGNSDTSVQPGYPQAIDLISRIPGTGATTIVDICLGINDNNDTVDAIKGYIQAGIEIIKASRPDVIINLTSPNIRNSTEFYKLPIVYKELTDSYGYGYINVAENVWKSWEETDGYFLDADHPNEYGQKKMGEYILSKLVPEDLRLSYLSNIPVPLGYLSNLPVNDPIKNSGFRCEVIYTTGTSTGSLFLKKLADNKWYFFDALTGDSVSYAIPLKNGQQTMSEGGYLSARKMKALITIKDYSVLDAVPSGSTYYPIENFSVTEFTKNKSLNKSVFELTEDNYVMKKPVTILRGSIDKNDPNYAVLKNTGLRIELRQTMGTSFTNLYIKKSASGKWAIYSSTSGDQISNDLVMVNGFRNVSKVSWNTTSDFECKIYIEDYTVFNTFPDTTSYIKLKNALVTETPREKTVAEHLKFLYDSVFG